MLFYTLDQDVTTPYGGVLTPSVCLLPPDSVRAIGYLVKTEEYEIHCLDACSYVTASSKDDLSRVPTAEAIRDYSL